MHHTGGIDHANFFELDPGRANLFEEPYAFPQQHGYEVNEDLVDHSRFKILSRNIGTADSDVFVARGRFA